MGRLGDMAYSTWASELEFLLILVLLLVLPYSVFGFLFFVFSLLCCGFPGHSRRQQLMLRVNAHFRFLRQTLLPHGSPSATPSCFISESETLTYTYGTTTTFQAVCQKANCLTGSCAKNFTAYLHLTNLKMPPLPFPYTANLRQSLPRVIMLNCLRPVPPRST